MDYIRNWSIEFSIVNNTGVQLGRGVALVRALTPEEANNLLKSSGQYNGSPQYYRIINTQEIVNSPTPMLICEEIVDNAE